MSERDAPRSPGASAGPSVDDLLDLLVAEYSDAAAHGGSPRKEAFLARAPASARPGLERCFKMIDTGRASAPGTGSALAPGLRLGRYRLVRELGRGGMALVWLAEDAELRRPVALKLLRPGLALEERHVERFRREALAVARLRHPHVVQVFDVGTAAGWQYIAMEYVSGPSLATVFEALEGSPRRSADELVRATGEPRLARPGERFEQALARLLAGVADGLHAAHEEGLVHRDVKPSNVLLSEDGRALVADFGLAKSDGDPALSLTGDTIGTPHYMSPEQAWLVETDVDRRSDVYSLGITAYEGLSGRRPFEGRTVLEVFEAIRSRVVPSLRSVAPGAGADAAHVCAKATARAREERYPDAASLAEDLRRVARGEPTRARLERAGLLRRLRAGWRILFGPAPYEYRSARTFLGLPLVHVVHGRAHPGAPLRVARGWFASGQVAVGGIALGGVALGGLTSGGISLGLVFGWGGVATGLVSIGGLSAGALAFGGAALGLVAFGGVGLGYAAMGGLVRGVYAVGGSAFGRYVHCPSLGRSDPEALAWFEEHLGWLRALWPWGS